MTTGANDFYYSPKYEDDEYEYRHVHVTKVCYFSLFILYRLWLTFIIIILQEVAKLIPKNRLMTETEWRSLGIQQVSTSQCLNERLQSPGWVHYMIHSPERHVLLFRRPLPDKIPCAPPNNGNPRTRVGAR